MAKYCIIAYPECDEGYLPRKETTVEARDKTEAWYKASRLFPEYHEIGIYETDRPVVITGLFVI